MQKWQFYAVVGDNGYGLADDWRQASAFLDNLDNGWPKGFNSEEEAYEAIEEYKAALNARLTEYIAEDITQFLTGLDMMRDGLSTGDADRVIGGNVVIQRVLGREPQFTNQQEFDELMGSDMDLIL